MAAFNDSRPCEKINRGEMTEDEFRIVALEFAKVVVEKARGMFKEREV